ncbi:MAG: serine/threonine protein kinase [Planctomycetes bacterium]|nr:serine/threonine protein kinase [Planctomycetota bacterium]
MSTEFHRRVQQVLEEAAGLEPGQQEQCIQHACADDPSLLREVRSLLPHYQKMEDFEPERPAAGSSWQMPGTVAFARAGEEAAAAGLTETERQPPFAIDHYTVVELLGHGGMGVVYRAMHPTLQRDVAIKLLRKGLLTQEDRRRFTFEEEILRHLQHPGIARFLHAGLAQIRPIDASATAGEELPYFAMEYISGLSLREYAGAHALDTRARLALLTKVCEAVDYAHHRGIVHRDLKPDNILVEESGQPKILDFGVAHILSFQSSLVRDKDGYFAGTLAYASPEQAAGRIQNLTPRSDVYTLGLVAHELLTGELPRRVKGHLRLALGKVRLDANVRRPSQRESEFRYYLAAILATALRKTRGQVYCSAGEFGADLESLLASYPPRSLWYRLVHGLSGLLASPSPATSDSASRPLRAVLRKRIAMALESEDYRSSVSDD